MPGIKITRRIIIILLALIGVFIGSTVLSLKRPGTERTTIAASSPPPNFGITGKVDLGDVKKIAYSSSGNHFWVLSNSGIISVYTRKGAKVYSTDAGPANAIALSPDGDYACVYSACNPAYKKVLFLDKNGNQLWKMDLDGAAWCADSANTDDGVSFLIGTGSKRIYSVFINKKSRRYKRWRVPGAVLSINIDRAGRNITYTTWQNSAIERSTIAGSNIWSVKTDLAKLYYLRQIVGSKKILAYTLPDDEANNGAFEFYNGSGKRILRGWLNAAEEESITVSSSGDYFCISSKKLIKHKGNSMKENHVVLFDKSGSMLWEKGSPFFKPSIVLMAANGYVVLSDGKKSLFTVNVAGELKPSIKLPSEIDSSVASPDGSQVIIRSGKIAYIVSIL